MTWRGLGALLLLILVGGGAGFGLSTRFDQPAPAAGTPKPLAASRPAYPYTPPIEVLPDPEQPPPLQAPFDTVQETLGGGPFAVTFPVPRGWLRTNTLSGEAKWTIPGATADIANTHFLRVEQVGSQTRTPAQQVALRISDLQGAAISDFRVIESTDNQLIASFVLDGFRRFSVIRWVSPRRTSNAEIEIAATGRQVDLAGLKDLVGLVAAEIRPRA